MPDFSVTWVAFVDQHHNPSNAVTTGSIDRVMSQFTSQSGEALSTFPPTARPVFAKSGVPTGNGRRVSIADCRRSSTGIVSGRARLDRAVALPARARRADNPEHEARGTTATDCKVFAQPDKLDFTVPAEIRLAVVPVELVGGFEPT